MRLPGYPPLDPAMNPGGYMNGRGVYEVEEEMLALYVNLDARWYIRIWTRSFWRLKALEFSYWPTSAQSVLSDRQRHARELADYQKERAA